MPRFNIDRAELHYEDVGSGPPVVVIHGAAGSGKSYVENLAPHLKDAYRLLIPDLRGMGQSSRVSGDLSPVSSWVTDAIGLLDALGLDRAHFIGVSLGARIAGRLATTVPERVITLMVDNPILANEEHGNAQLNANYTDIPEDSDAARRHRGNHGEDWREVVASFFHIRNQPELQQYLNLRPFIAEMKMPVLIARGDNVADLVHPLAHAIEWHEALPSSWLWISPNTVSGVTNQPAEFRVVYSRFQEAFAS